MSPRRNPPRKRNQPPVIYEPFGRAPNRSRIRNGMPVHSTQEGPAASTKSKRRLNTPVSDRLAKRTKESSEDTSMLADYTERQPSAPASADEQSDHEPQVHSKNTFPALTGVDKAVKAAKTMVAGTNTSTTAQRSLQPITLTMFGFNKQAKPKEPIVPAAPCRLEEISRAMTAHTRTLVNKPPPQGMPIVWADSRQALCETVPYFKMQYSGCHANEGHIYGLLIDGTAQCRDYLDGDVVVARAAGGMEGESSSMQQAKNHSLNDSQAVSFVNDIQYRNPIVVITGNKSSVVPCSVPHRYCILGWFKPIAIWVELTKGKNGRDFKTVKFRLERLKSTIPWWVPQNNDLAFSPEEAGPLHHQACSECNNEYPQVYLPGWVCLNADCRKFWELPSGEQAATSFIDYNPAWLLSRQEWENEMPPYDIKPALPNIGKALGDNLTYINTRGVCCPLCGRCNSRYLFSGWRCDNQACTWSWYPKHRPVIPGALNQPWDIAGNGPALTRCKVVDGVHVKTSYVWGYKVQEFSFKGVEGSLIHASANAALNKQKGSADEMFAALQSVEIGLKRRRFATERGANAETADPNMERGDFMSSFSINYGMPYKFIASGNSLPFDGSPWPVRESRARLNWAAKAFGANPEHDDFNEELILAYMEGQKLEYHDDGEDGLGPMIATLSIGGSAKMHLRLKRKHYVGCSKTGLLTSEKPVPGGYGGEAMFTKRLAAWKQIEEMKSKGTAAAEIRAKQKQLAAQLRLPSVKAKNAPDSVVINLRHGDIVIMNGYEVQRFMEHKVVPDGMLRFALTCRTVLPGHLKPDELPDYEVKADDYVYKGPSEVSQQPGTGPPVDADEELHTREEQLQLILDRLERHRRSRGKARANNQDGGETFLDKFLTIEVRSVPELAHTLDPTDSSVMVESGSPPSELPINRDHTHDNAPAESMAVYNTGADDDVFPIPELPVNAARTHNVDVSPTQQSVQPASTNNAAPSGHTNTVNVAPDDNDSPAPGRSVELVGISNMAIAGEPSVNSTAINDGTVPETNDNGAGRIPRKMSIANIISHDDNSPVLGQFGQQVNTSDAAPSDEPSIHSPAMHDGASTASAQSGRQADLHDSTPYVEPFTATDHHAFSAPEYSIQGIQTDDLLGVANLASMSDDVSSVPRLFGQHPGASGFLASDNLSSEHDLDMAHLRAPRNMEDIFELGMRDTEVRNVSRGSFGDGI